MFTSTPPDYRLCRDCLGQLESLGYEPAPGAPYGDLPPCPDCGGQMVEVVPRQIEEPIWPMHDD
jgi:hypothetical protein